MSNVTWTTQLVIAQQQLATAIETRDTAARTLDERPADERLHSAWRACCEDVRDAREYLATLSVLTRGPRKPEFDLQTEMDREDSSL